jgi:hypothetical protein
VIDRVVDNMGKILAAVILSVLFVAVYAAIREDSQWKGYAAKHHCVSKGVKRGQITVGQSMDGKGALAIATTPDQTVYQCDAGEIQIR